MCFVDTLDLANGSQGTFGFMTQENVARVERQRNTPITVVMGNPPYNVGQLDENDNNRNRKYATVDRRVANTYVKDSVATLRMQVYDPYVKFFRWATDRLNSRDGIVCFVTNNSFVEQLAFDGMRKHLLQDFTRLYHLDLEGNVRQNPKLSGTAYNVFGIQVGVGITVAVRCHRHRGHRVLFHRVDKNLRRQQKLVWLAKHRDVKGVRWRALKADEHHTWIVAEHGTEYARFLPMGSKAGKASTGCAAECLFKVYGRGAATNSDAYVYDFDASRLAERAAGMVEEFNSELDRWKRAGKPESLEGILRVDEQVCKWIRNTKRTLLRGHYLRFDDSRIRVAQYRPFTRRFYYFERAFSEDTYRLPSMFPPAELENENTVIAVTDRGSEKPFVAMAARFIVDLHLVSPGSSTQCFPFYVYDEDGGNRRENITDWALKHFREHYHNKRITKWDIFYYVYGVLHQPGYRERFAENLKRELPRIPLAPLTLPSPQRGEGKQSGFRAFAAAGQKLARLHLDYEKLEPWPLEWIETPGVPLSYRVDDKMRFTKDKTALKVNDSLTLARIPPEALRYRLGNRSALEWVVDQYQVSEDKRSGIRSDPNRPDDPEYIVRLVGQVVRVSIETMKTIDALPPDFGGGK